MKKVNDKKIKANAEIVKQYNELCTRVCDLLGKANPITDEGNEVETINAQISDIVETYDFFDVAFEENGKWGVRDIDGNLKVPADYDEVGSVYNCLYVSDNIPVNVKKNNHFGLVKSDGSGDPVTAFIYDRITLAENRRCFRVVANGKKGYVSDKGVTLIPTVMDKIYEDCNGVIAFEANGKSGLLYDEYLYVAPVYDELFLEPDDLVKVRLGDKWGWIDENGNFTEEESDAFVYPDSFPW